MRRRFPWVDLFGFVTMAATLVLVWIELVR